MEQKANDMKIISIANFENYWTMQVKTDTGYRNILLVREQAEQLLTLCNYEKDRVGDTLRFKIIENEIH